MSSDAFYQEIVQEVLPLLADYGATFEIRSKGTYDPATRKTTVPESRFAQGVVTNGYVAAELGSDVGGANKGGQFIVGHRTLILEPDANLVETDEVNVDGIWMDCTRMETLKPGNIVVMYTVTIGG